MGKFNLFHKWLIIIIDLSLVHNPGVGVAILHYTYFFEKLTNLEICREAHIYALS